LPATFLVFAILMPQIPFRILSFCLDCEPFAFYESVSVATFFDITFCVYLLALPFSCQHFFYLSFFLLFLFSFCCSSYPQVSCQLRFVFANHYYLHLRNFYKFSLFRWEKRYIVCMTGFCLFYVVCQILYLNFYVSYFRWLATHPL